MRQWRLILLTLTVAPMHLFAAAKLEKLTDVRLVDNPANDADSFVVQAGERQLHLRLYFADAPEGIATTDADAKRVRDQARYFGITDSKKVLEYGREAKAFAAKALSSPFTIHTAFASALGRSPGGRVYAFVLTADGKDFAQLLVENGLARAHGTRRDGPGGTSAEKIQNQLEDLESAAMLKRKGIWAATDPEVITKLRAMQREEEQEIKDVLKESSGKHAEPGQVELNTATTRDLQSISGIGPVLAARIMEGRPYKSVDDLRRVTGIGDKLLEKIRPYLRVEAKPEAGQGSP